MKKTLATYTGAIWLFFLLVLVRAFEDKLFYDPFLAYFQGDFLGEAYPKYNFWWLLLFHFFRYTLNATISLGILYVLFRSRSLLKLSVYLYLIAFIILIVTYFWLLNHSPSNNYLLMFYVRRFLIHPIIVLILIPAFYYQDKKHRNA